jgi:hypothetical protein
MKLSSRNLCSDGKNADLLASASLFFMPFVPDTFSSPRHGYGNSGLPDGYQPRGDGVYVWHGKPIAFSVAEVEIKRVVN